MSLQIQLKSLAEEMQAIIKGLEKLKQELVASENDGPVSEVFRKVHSCFFAFYSSTYKQGLLHCLHCILPHVNYFICHVLFVDHQRSS